VIHRRRSPFVAVVLAAALLFLPLESQRVTAEQLPTRLSDQEFWKIASEYSEPDGTFHSENLVSNEIRFQTVIPSLVEKAVKGRAYVGVGSEQNFTYIAAVRPAIAFIVDIRRGNLDLHLIYKALFEMSADRAEFVSRMFARPRPSGLTATSTAAEIFAAYAQSAQSQALHDQNLKEIKEHLVTKHGFKLSAGDLDGIEFVYGAWYRFGPDIRYELTAANGILRGGSGGAFPSYAELMTTTDGIGTNRSYLATEDAFKFLKDLETRNMLVPVVGNFGGPKALRAVAAYLKQKETVVSAFYTSNVEQYLRQDGIWGNFCSSTATMPLDDKSLFIRSARGGFANQPAVVTQGAAFAVEVLPLKPDVAACPGR
jgi:hypothetical protein